MSSEVSFTTTLWRLDRRSWRYGERKNNLGTITHKMLSQQLRELERDGLITRKAHAEVPPRVEYSITTLGKTTLPIIEALRTWERIAGARPGMAVRPASPPVRRSDCC